MQDSFEERILKMIPKLVKTAVAAIITEDNKILLEKRSSLIDKNKWCLPGGALEYGETALTGIKREVKEETGLTLENIKFLGYFDEIIPEMKNHSVVLIYSGKTNGTPKMQKSEVQELKWFTKEETDRLDIAYRHKEIIEKYWSAK